MSATKFLQGCAVALVALNMTGCSGEYAGEPVSSIDEAIVRGDPLDTVARPYEEAMVTVQFNAQLDGGCSGVLLGNQGTAQYVLTARHCLAGITVPSSIRIGRNSTAIALGKRIWMHPNSSDPMPNTVDVALVELDRAVPLSTKQFFTNLTPSELVGESTRCYGGGSQVGTTITSAVFTIIPTTSSGSQDIHHNLVNPNASDQRVGKGDSGGVCVRLTGDTQMTIFGVHKSGSTTSARQTAAVSFSNWVRTFVPR